MNSVPFESYDPSFVTLSKPYLWRELPLKYFFFSFLLFLSFSFFKQINYFVIYSSENLLSIFSWRIFFFRVRTFFCERCTSRNREIVQEKDVPKYVDNFIEQFSFYDWYKLYWVIL